mmetsp:Transcript_4914/g.8995  ORF Transcript_4914/g.8995 Transcript_4914/m.8995 type:complete len:210 (+) Transcript_4914:954-1583(+)
MVTELSLSKSPSILLIPAANKLFLLRSALTAPSSIYRLPRLRSPCAIHRLRPFLIWNRSGRAKNTVPNGVPWFMTKSSILSGCLPWLTQTVTPAAVASRAATIFVTIPPVPHCVPPLPSTPNPTCKSSRFCTIGIGFASGFVLGLSVYNISTSVNKNSHLAFTNPATNALSESLSPKRSSSVATVSFSFTIGTTPILTSSSNVSLALKY